MKKGRGYKAGYRSTAGAVYAGRSEEMDRELTGMGKLVCLAAGVLEALAVFLLLGIRISLIPVPVLVFLFLLFAILTGAAMIGADELLDWNRRRAKASRRASGCAAEEDKKVAAWPTAKEWTKAS